MCSLFLCLLFSIDSKARAGTLLWEVSGNGLNSPSYLLGSMHLVPAELLSEDSLFAPILDKVKTLVTEIPLDIEFNTYAVQGKFMLMEEGQSYEKQLGARAWSRWKRYMQDSLMVSEEAILLYQNIKPMFLEALLLHEWMPEAISVDEYVFRLCKKRNLPNLGLETFKEQLDLLNSLSIDVQFETFSAPPALKNDYRRLFHMYLEANPDSLCRIEQQQLSGVLLEARNVRWLEQLPDLFNKTPCLVCVGVAHLGCPGGLIAGLLKKGYRVRPVNAGIPISGGK